MNNLDYWIGGSDLNAEGKWEYVNGKPMKMGTPFWAISMHGGQEPNDLNDENCLLIYKRDFYFFNDDQCDRLKAAICQHKPSIV